MDAEELLPPCLIRCHDAPKIALPMANGVLGIFAALFLGGLGLWLVLPRGTDAAFGAGTAAMLGLALLGVGAGQEIAAAKARRRLRAIAAEISGRGAEAEAIRHVARVRGRRTSRPIDAGEWLHRFGPGALSLGVPVPPIDPDGEPVSEAVDVGAGRRRRRWRERRVHWAMVVVLAGMALMFMTWVMQGMPLKIAIGTPLFTLLVYVPSVLAFAAQLGYRPIELTSIVAEPGRVRRTSWGRTDEFTRGDSILVLESGQRNGGEVAVSHAAAEPTAGPPVIAWLVRRDGRIWAHRYQGHDDPGLVDLYHRWMAEPARGPSERPPTDAASSAGVHTP